MSRTFYANKVLASSFLIAMSMVALEVSLLIGIFCALLMFWKWGVEKYGWKPLSRRWTSVLSVIALVQVIVQFRTLVGQEPSYTFLLALSALRVMDYRTERDHRFVVLLGFLLVSIKALFSLDIYWIVPSALAFAGFWYSLLPQNYPHRARLLVRMFILSLPFAVIMFFAFPRFVLPWAMSRGANQQAEIGFSDELNPGKVADLAATSAMAFRAKLGNIPLAVSADLYWRGSVLKVSKGLSWAPGKGGLGNLLAGFNQLPTYDVAIEPTSARYMFSLDGTRMIRSDFGSILPLDGDVFRSTRPLTKAAVYVGYFDKDYVDTQEPTNEDKQIPPLRGKVSQWVDSVKAKHLDERGRLNEIKKLFAESGFLYTLSPGVYGPNDLEEFLFNRKRGFCEHFAGGYASLVRALDIPARVVIGYQGGKYNPWGDFWRVSQKDAHAWTEVFTEGSWQRVDPTTWVAPLRLAIGAEEFFNLSEEDQAAFAKSSNWRPASEDLSLAWDQITLWAEDLNYQWTYFLIDFDRNSQQDFWQNIFQHKGPAVIIFIVVGLFIYTFSRGLFVRGNKLDKNKQLILQVEKWGRTRNKSRRTDETPLSYLKRLAKEFPALTQILGQIAEHYDLSTYKEKETAAAKTLLIEWKKEIKKGL